ncbi:alpha/beta hydrolase [Tianweitania sp.]|uniref:alpha/beta hydrolase n=1 Tax=Tianweitania sp. TaxID=2021634 RepID=UPI002897D06D|nr:alpha/beta hydrolase-fold protein [Tianweitania sp.]
MSNAYSLAGASVHDIEAASGAVYRLLLYVPRMEVPDYLPARTMPGEGWPLLLMTDGNSCFGTAVDALRSQADYPKGTNIGWGVIATVGYPTEEAYDPLRRSWDLSPPPGTSFPPYTPDGPPVRTGGADEFLDFLETRLLPFIDERTKIDPARKSLFGHSFGGLFALHALFTRPALFQKIIAVSPTIHWDDCAILRTEKAATFDVPVRPSVHLSAGEHEGERLAPFQEGNEDAAARLISKKTERTLAYAEEMAARLAEPDGANLQTSFENLANHTHMSAPTPAIARAVQLAFSLKQSNLA